MEAKQAGEKRRSGAARAVTAVGVGALAMLAAKAAINIFGPQPAFAMCPLGAPLDSAEFIQFLGLVTDGTRRRTHLRRLKNGDEFYPAEMRAIESAERAIDLEYYEFQEGEVSGRMLEALAERARAGVEVRMIVDAVGSLHTRNSYFDGLRAAGGQMRWYHPLRWDTWPELNQRTHRKLTIVDGHTGFIGGAGVADHWLRATRKGPRWRDTVFRAEGEGVAGLLSVFAENWLEASGDILSGPKQFGFECEPIGEPGFVVSSTPRGGGTQARILFQALIRSAQKSIRITTPYFLPDRSARRALEEAARERGVQVQVLTAGPHIDHPIVHVLSRGATRSLIRAGAEVYDYQPAMIHAKLMTIDEQWCVVGSTNFDHRSFALNDEVNLAVLDRELAGVIESDFREDLGESRRLTEAMLGHRSGLDALSWIVEHAIRFET